MQNPCVAMGWGVELRSISDDIMCKRHEFKQPARHIPESEILMSFQIQKSEAEGFQVFTLTDTTTGLTAKVAPELGFNLFSLVMPINGEPARIITEPQSLADLKKSPSRAGHPVLFPFPNRIANGRYTWRGKTWSTPAPNGGHAIHGFAHSAAWRVLETKADANSARIIGVFQISENSPEHLNHWPADARLEITYTLHHSGIEILATVSNPSQTDELPWGLGYHTYYNLPLTKAGNTAETSIVIPASRRWKLDHFIPTGEKEALPDALDFRHGRPLAGLKADDVLTDLSHSADGNVHCHLRDRAAKYEVSLITGRHFTEMVVFTPSWNPESIALEPYTQTTDAINLLDRGMNGGLRILGPGMSEQLRMQIVIKPVE